MASLPVIDADQLEAFATKLLERNKQQELLQPSKGKHVLDHRDSGDIKDEQLKERVETAQVSS